MANPPYEIDDRVGINGRFYTVADIQPYMRRDGEASWVVTWEGRCATCDAPFLVKEGCYPSRMNVRCVDHHRPLYSWKSEAKVLRRKQRRAR